MDRVTNSRNLEDAMKMNFSMKHETLRFNFNFTRSFGRKPIKRNVRLERTLHKSLYKYNVWNIGELVSSIILTHNRASIEWQLVAVITVIVKEISTGTVPYWILTVKNKVLTNDIEISSFLMRLVKRFKILAIDASNVNTTNGRI